MIAVSYTHLDVYKRQSTDCGMIDINAPSLGIRPHNIRNTAPDASAILLTTLVIATRPTSVSYTHLDVYKRQVIGSS